jgi:hypothetical protein
MTEWRQLIERIVFLDRVSPLNSPSVITARIECSGSSTGEFGWASIRIITSVGAESSGGIGASAHTGDGIVDFTCGIYSAAGTSAIPSRVRDPSGRSFVNSAPRLNGNITAGFGSWPGDGKIGEQVINSGAVIVTIGSVDNSGVGNIGIVNGSMTTTATPGAGIGSRRASSGQSLVARMTIEVGMGGADGESHWKFPGCTFLG